MIPFRVQSFIFWLTVATHLGTLQASFASRTVPLSSLNLTTAVQGWGTPGADMSVEHHPLTIHGQKYTSGFGTHAVGLLLLNLNGGTSHFHAVVGVDDETMSKGSVTFSVLADGKEIWTSGLLKGGDPGKDVDVDLAGVKKLALVVGDGGDGTNYDHADWADASFEVTGAMPVTARPAQSDPVLSLRPSPTLPELHVPRLFGAHPDTPFSLFIPVTGWDPIRLSAADLPAGVSFDPLSGTVSGMLRDPGTYLLRFKAANRYGIATGSVEVKVGETLALTPPMGWNSYDGYGDSVTETEILNNAAAIKKSLKAHGWQYVVVDYRWYDPGAHDNNANARAGATLTMDQYGRLQPSLNRFPSAADGAGFKPLADRIHAMGLKFGIHIMRGIPRNAVAADLPIEGSNFTARSAYHTDGACSWCQDMYPVSGNSAAGQAWYDSLFRQYASWGLDFVKVDDLSQPYHTDEVQAIRRAIDRCGRAIVFSTSPGPTPVEEAASVERLANQWRITGDMWDSWSQLVENMNYGRQWYGRGTPGHWPDSDMLPFGLLSVGNRSVDVERTTRLTRAEQLSLVTYDVLMPSPLMLGGDFTHADGWETSLLTNDEVLAVDQDARGSQGHCVYDKNGVVLWTKPLKDGSVAVGLFNQNPEDGKAVVDIAALGLTGRYTVRDLWQRKEIGTTEGVLTAFVPAHGAVLFRFTSSGRS